MCIRDRAETILRLVREEGYRYRDFAVVTGALEEYGREAERIFRSAGIPLFLDQKRDVMMNPFVEFIRSAVDMAVQNCSYESVFRFLRCGLADFTEDEADRMENYVPVSYTHLDVYKRQLFCHPKSAMEWII